MKTLLVIVAGSKEMTECPFHLIVAETGEHLASHFCSHSWYAESDLYSSREERIEEYKKRFGEVEVKFLSDTDISLGEILKRNEDWWKNQELKNK